jgi:hypothetical protein
VDRCGAQNLKGIEPVMLPNWALARSCLPSGRDGGFGDLGAKPCLCRGPAWVVFVSGGYTTFWEERGNMPGAAVACRSGLSGPAFVGRLVMRVGEPERSPSFGGELGTRTATPPPPPPRRVVYVVSGKSDRVGFWSWFGFGVWFLGGKVWVCGPVRFWKKGKG